jgi:glucosamine--fructose-6-phosphate aminotransferase (isomerizing)
MVQAAQSHMLAETVGSPDVVKRLIENEGSTLAALGRRCRNRTPSLVATCARGSSDNAATFLKYALGIMTGTPVASIGPSVASVYGAPLRLDGAVLVTISQSGRSPELVSAQAAAKRAGALTVAFLNVTDSPVAAAADIVIPLHAGPEKSSSATKTFIASIAAATAFASAWAGDEKLTDSLNGLHEALAANLKEDWSITDAALKEATSVYTFGRGPGYALAKEARLKFRETAGMGSESFTSVDLNQGPLRVLAGTTPTVAFIPDDAALTSNQQGLEKMVKAGAPVFTASPRTDLPGTRLGAVSTGNGFTDTIAMAPALFRMVEHLTRLKGLDPDRPQYLAKIAERR